MILLSLIAAAGMLTDAPGKVKSLYEESIETGRYVATAGDLRSISTMLDYHYLRRGRYPRTDRFGKWMTEAFKENQLKSLTIDHWGQEYDYRASANLQAYVLISSGPDGIPGTDDDLKMTGP
ncbi:MAG: type II secretion system protein GspG [Desulfuromonadales bacterium]|nr:type II secretion system protein GspG [Desulfuromonadales bacterium]